MQKNSLQQRDALLTKVHDGLKKAEGLIRSLKKKNSRFIYGSIVASGLSTLVAGLTAALGPLAGEGPPAWRITCGLVALFTASAGIMSGLHKQLSISDRLANATACAGKLAALEFGINVLNRDVAEAAKEYELVLSSYQDIVVGST